MLLEGGDATGGLVPLAGMLAETVHGPTTDSGRLEVKTFHQLCEDLARATPIAHGEQNA